jgi:hypothetical protein
VYNRAFFAEKRQDYQQAYRLVRLAQKFNPDSRSNVRFEIGLYNRWGQQLIERGDIYNSFQVFSEACERHPTVTEFCHNMKTAFFKAALQSWTNKNWTISRELFDGIADCESLEEGDEARIKQILKNWAAYFVRHRMNDEIREVAALLEYFDPEDPFLIDFKSRLESSH